ncbi:MAG TPA: hypothetical protein VM935_01555 [Chitinophagaceae bacterium]|nr:hypothetical protein [Chitinophagaceae bacterium]
MKNILILFLAIIISAVFIRARLSSTMINAETAARDAGLSKLRYGAGCSPDLLSIDFKSPANVIPLLRGWGKYRMPVTFKNDSAYTYFQQGINMYYGFHIIEALASFEKAVLFDSAFAMGYWGKALAYGPNINDLGYAASPEALLAVKKAAKLCTDCTPVEKALIGAMAVRYSADSTQKREDLNQRYADAMKKVHLDFPASGDAAALYADALMVQHPWDLYDRSYNPKPWTPEIVRVLEGLIKTFPQNPGANHYYIHAIEGSQHPEKGLEVANRLGGFMPGLAHLVHMPSHIYIRSGYYKKGVEVNEKAVEGYNDYLSKFPIVANGSFIYLMHNLHMKAACAAMDGNYSKAMKFAEETRSSVDSSYLSSGGFFGMYSQFLHITPMLTQVRFGKWQDILNTATFPDEWVYARSMQHFAKAMAYTRTKQLDIAMIEWQQMMDSVTSTQLQDHPTAFNPGIAAVEVAEKVAFGMMAAEMKDYPMALKFLIEAVEKEDGMLYNEPRDWQLPSRQYLGHVLLGAKKYKEAEAVYKKDLRINPNNKWSLTGLSKALQMQGKKGEASAVAVQLKKLTATGDDTITASVF